MDGNHTETHTLNSKRDDFSGENLKKVIFWFLSERLKDNPNAIVDTVTEQRKASLDADIKYNKMRHGQSSVAEWEKAQAIFDNLSKSANFAACKRKPGDMAG